MKNHTMRALVILGLLTICHAGYSGYNYNNPPINHGPLPHFSDVSSQSFGSGPALSDSFSNRFSKIGGFDGFGGSGSFGSNYPEHHGTEPIVTKQFYFHSAPEEVDEPVHKHIYLGSPRRNYRVVFIRAPTVARSPTRVSVVQAPHEDKTVIYVLSKKTDTADIQADIQPASHQHNKPEVFFIKYKTQEEALQAQQQIQAQYDALGGTSQVSDEGVAPFTSVIGSTGGGSLNFAGSDSLHSPATGPGYLPTKNN